MQYNRALRQPDRSGAVHDRVIRSLTEIPAKMTGVFLSPTEISFHLTEGHAQADRVILRMTAVR